MARLFSNRDRPLDLGVLPTELLPRAAAEPVAGARQPGNAVPAGPDAVLAALPEYRALFDQHRDGPVAPVRAPVPDDLVTRSRNLKASAYFLDASLAGVCEIQPQDRLPGAPPTHRHAFVFLVECTREPQPGEPGAAWIRGTRAERADLRCAEIAVVIADTGKRRGLVDSAYNERRAQCDRLDRLHSRHQLRDERLGLRDRQRVRVVAGDAGGDLLQRGRRGAVVVSHDGHARLAAAAARRGCWRSRRLSRPRTGPRRSAASPPRRESGVRRRR